jgi:L-rhamnose mutarotase
METDVSFSFGRKEGMDAVNAKVEEWEELMWKFQNPLPWAMDNER